MTDKRPWDDAATYAQSHDRRVVRGPTGPDRDALAAEYRDATDCLPACRPAASSGRARSRP